MKILRHTYEKRLIKFRKSSASESRSGNFLKEPYGTFSTIRLTSPEKVIACS